MPCGLGVLHFRHLSYIIVDEPYSVRVLAADCLIFVIFNIHD
nr:MAG TPA: hypothetical protein [Caudoviricetes sp.]